VGKPCETEDGPELCPPSSAVAEGDVGKLFCHDINNVCAMYCKTDDDCEENIAADWVCDKQKNKDGAYSNGSSFPVCVNPICEIPEGEANNCGNSDVGEACMPMISGKKFSSNDIYIETNSTACETRICGVFGFSGDPREVATKRLQEKVYCTCRCRSSDPDISTCKCPDGFECSENILGVAGPAAAGGYCIRKND